MNAFSKRHTPLDHPTHRRATTAPTGRTSTMTDLIRQRLASRIVRDPSQRAVIAAIVDRAETSDLDGLYGTVTASLAHISVWSHVGPVRASQAITALRSAGVLITHDGAVRWLRANPVKEAA